MIHRCIDIVRSYESYGCHSVTITHACSYMYILYIIWDNMGVYCIHLYTIYRNHHWSYKSMGPSGGFILSFWSPTGRRVAEMCFTIPRDGEDKRLSTKIMRQGLHHLQQSLASKAERKGGSGCILWTARRAGESLVVSWCFMGEGKFHCFSKSLFAEEMTVFT